MPAVSPEACRRPRAADFVNSGVTLRPEFPHSNRTSDRLRRPKSKMKLSVSTLPLLAVVFAGAALADSPFSRPIGDSRLIAPVPFPGYPEGIAVHEGRIYVSTPAAFGVPGNFVPSEI